MTRKQRIKELLSKSKRSSSEDKELLDFQNKFISKSKVNPRLFDTSFERTGRVKKYSGINRRNDGKLK